MSYGDGGTDYAGARRSGWTGDQLSLNQWNHVVAIIRGATDMFIYINGVDKLAAYGGTGGTMVHSAQPAVLGKAHSGYFSGNLDDVRIYDRALTEEEIQELYHEGGWGD